ncbi:glycosyltransferase involved in cell wall biosynthesis [Bacillus ectoiniformans]|uniref:glycosyltransferase n=1 Tax=Bacillus ectoiniformans TaxID=1494429 RepID=UPI0019577447|nr:glycosyltransferase [Bacillus ectoiniformans]MBM7649367.1 glycosyltransferase involved in cell wall biosynthesis [Bacillus ectoiniformans]
MKTEDQQQLLKQKIEGLINKGLIQEATDILEKYEILINNEKWLLATKAILHLLKGDLNTAELLLIDGLYKYPFNADILFNLAYLYELKKEYQKAYDFYMDAHFALNDKEKVSAIEAIKRIETMSPKFVEKHKIAVFVKPGLDNFIDDIIQGLSDEYKVRKILVKSYDQIDQGMEWADTCWFEWCDELIVYGSKHKLAKKRKIICRLHRYEVFTNYPIQVCWENVDKLLIVTDHLKLLLQDVIPDLDQRVSIETFKNGVDIKKFPFEIRKKGYNIAFIGYIHLRKNPILLLQTIKKLVDMDPKYKLYIAGKFQEPLAELYWNYQVNELKLANNIIFDGWQDNIEEWLQDKEYIISTSIHESFGYGIAEAMARGIKPVIHNFPFAKEIWPEQHLFNTIEEAVKTIMSSDYNSQEYRKYVENNFTLEEQLKKLKFILKEISDIEPSSVNKRENEEMLIQELKRMIKRKVEFKSIENLTLFLPTYNRTKIVISDIEKGHKLGNQKKIIVDDFSEESNQEILKSFFRSNSIKGIFHQQNYGVAKTFHTAFNNIETKLTQFSGDDDLIFCFDTNRFIDSIEKVGVDYSLVVPRYIVNLDENGDLKISYDRSNFNYINSLSLLKHFAITGEMSAFIAGTVCLTEIMKESVPDPIFKVSEDFVALVRYLSKNPQRKIKVSDSYVYIRRVSKNTLSGTQNIEKLLLHILSLMISGYYCLSMELIGKEEFLDAIRKRCSLLNTIYSFGNKFTHTIFGYLLKTIDLDQFIQLLNSNYNLEILKDEIPMEICKLPYLLQK